MMPYDKSDVINDHYALITPWYEHYQAYKKWDNMTKTSQSKKLCSLSKIWLVNIPVLMGKSFGKVRTSPKDQLANSPYQSKWILLRRKVSDYNAAQVDGREEELPDVEGPTGGGCDENGVEDDRMVKAAVVDNARDVKRNNRFVNADIDEDTLKIIKFFNESFPESVSGVGLMSECEATGGGDRKRGSCDIDGLNSDALADDLDAPAAKKATKSSLIIDLTKTSIQQHEEMMAFNRSNLEYQKESRTQDIARRNDRDIREREYRDKQDTISQQRYSETREDAKEMQGTFANILKSLVTKL